jgi:hypothetical protein
MPSARGRPASELAAAGRGARANSSLRSSDTRAGFFPARPRELERVPGRARGRLARRPAPPAAGELQRSPGRRLRRPGGLRKSGTRLAALAGCAQAAGEARPDPVPLRAPDGGVSGREGCPASDVRARAGPRTVPRAGRRIRRARVFERSEAFALAPAARAAGPMRVARAQRRRGAPLPSATLMKGRASSSGAPVLSCSRLVRRGRGLPCRRSRSARRRRGRRGLRCRGRGGLHRLLPSR